MKRNKGKRRNSGRKTLPEKGTKNQRRDAEIADTARREYNADARERRDCYRSQENDWQWYAQNQQLVTDYASYPFGKAVGSKVNFGTNSAAVNVNRGSIPGVMAYYFAPTIGNPTDSNAPVNIAARNIYSYVRHVNSGHSNYDAPDLMLYLLAMDSVYTFHSFMKRALGLLYDYSTLNRYYPSAVLTAMGLDPDDLRNNIANFRGFINTFAVKMGSMCVPNSMSYMARHVWMCEGLYVDSSTTKAQTYFYTPAQLYQFQRDTTTQAGTLNSVSLFTLAGAERKGQSYTQRLMKFADVVEFANSLLDPIIAEEDFNIMSGDILKAFGDGGVIRVSGVAEGYMVLPSYSQEVLSQMENATILGGIHEETIRQNMEVEGAGWLYSDGALDTMNVPFNVISGSGDKQTVAVTGNNINSMEASLLLDKLLNFHWDGVTPEQVMVATRLSWVAQPSTKSSVDVTYYNDGGVAAIPVTPIGVGSEILVDAAMWWYTWSDLSMSLVYERIPTILFNKLNRVDGSYQITSLVNITQHDTLARLSMFDWHHLVWPITYGADVGTSNPISVRSVTLPRVPVQDVDNYTVINSANLENMSLTALLSEFSVPQMGAFSSKL